MSEGVRIPGWTIQLIPILAVLFTAAAGYADLVSRVQVIEKDRAEMVDRLQMVDRRMESVRASLGDVQINLDRICIKLEVPCKELRGQ